MSHKPSNAQIEEAFKAFDSDNSGAICVSEFKAIFQQLGMADIEDKVLQQLIDQFDSNKSGKMELSEFKQLLEALGNN
jgi:Ca2+-binding EF-hand superfamily protein